MTTLARRHCVLLLSTVIGCSGKGATGDGPLEARPGTDARRDALADLARDAPGATDAGFLAALEAQLAKSFTIGVGSLEQVNGPECCEAITGCSGNNPTTPYLGFWAPPGPGQTAPTLFQRKDGSSWFLRLRADEALLYVGTTPPETRYFGFTPYLWQRPLGFPVLASLSETLNHKVIATDAPAGAPPFERRTAVIATADATTLAAVKDALTTAGFPAQAVNSLVFDPAVSTFGLAAASDTFGVMLRAALFADPAKKAAYFAKPPGTVYRLTPRVAGTPSPLPSPSPRPKGTTTETALEGAVDLLALALRAKFASYTAVPLLVIPNTLDPAECISKPTTCLADNRDTIYPQAIRPSLFTAGKDEFYVVFGVNHDTTQKTTYANASVYSADHMYGVKAVTSDLYPGSARSYMPNHPDVDKLYAYKIARSCGAEPYCLEIPKGGCPSGIDDGKAGSITFRAYLEPSTNTAPDPGTLVGDRILYFHR